MIGLDLHFLPMAENRGSHQFLNWCQQVSTGHLHCYGFESCPILRKYKKRGLAPLFLYLVRMTGLEPARFWRWNLNPMSLPIPPHPHINPTLWDYLKNFTGLSENQKKGFPNQFKRTTENQEDARTPALFQLNGAFQYK